MDNHEFKQKNEFWHEINADYLQAQKEKEERKIKEEEENADKPDQKKKRKRQKRVPIQASTPGEAIEKMLQQRKLSFKLNYDVLKNLDPSNPPEEPSTPSKSAPEENIAVTPVKKAVRARSRQKALQAPVPLCIKKGISDIVGNARQKEMLAALAEEEGEIEEPPAKLQKTLLDEANMAVASTSIVDISSSPPHDNVPDDVGDDPDEEENEMSEEDEVAPARLTQAGYYEENDYGEDDEDEFDDYD